jgi:hypothetical protein
VHGEGGQATVEWVALVLAAALVLGASAALAPAEDELGLGELVAERIVRAPDEAQPDVMKPPSGAAPAPPSRAAPAAPVSAAQAVNAFRRLRGLEHVARHAWVACLGYRRWRLELAHPRAPTEAVPLRDALDIANDCLNPYDYLVGE